MAIDDILGTQLIQYHADGFTLQEIADATGIPKTTCYTYLRQRGVSTSRERKRPGCPDCKVKPYALGYCIKCYRRSRRLEGLN